MTRLYLTDSQISCKSYDVKKAYSETASKEITLPRNSTLNKDDHLVKVFSAAMLFLVLI